MAAPGMSFMEAAGRFWLIAGPHGAGKTTYAFRNVPAVSGSLNFVNLDGHAYAARPLPSGNGRPRPPWRR